MPGGPPCISVNIDSNLKNEWDCCKGGEGQKNVKKKAITKWIILSFITSSVCNVLPTSGGSFCTEDISREIICKTTKRSEKSVCEYVRFQRLSLTSVKNIKSNYASWKLPEARENERGQVMIDIAFASDRLRRRCRASKPITGQREGW